ncbi:diacylglycerol acyltransferase-domain-containing protein [Xylogone sp. PMI_703]|nr:diacylglycerol acyltransferase-domain-containing protein [Xylogone sp. PMI_703]
MEEGGDQSKLEELKSTATPTSHSDVSSDTVIKKGSADVTSASPIIQPPAADRSDDVNTLDSADDTNESTYTTVEEQQSLQSSDSTMYTAESHQVSDDGDAYEGSEGTLTASFEGAGGEAKAPTDYLDGQIIDHLEEQATGHDKKGEEEVPKPTEGGQLEQQVTAPVREAPSPEQISGQDRNTQQSSSDLQEDNTTVHTKIPIFPPEVLGKIEQDAPLESGSDTEVEDLGAMDGSEGISSKEIKDESFTTTELEDSVANSSSDTPAEEAKDTNRDTGINDKNTIDGTSHEADGTNSKDKTKNTGGDSVLRWIHASDTIEGLEKKSKQGKELVNDRLQSQGDELTNEKKKKTVVFEDVKGERNGSKLTSIKNEEFKKQLEVSRRELVSGRKAGQRWEQSRIRFAPLNVPLRRRLQTFMVLFHTLCMAMCISTFFFLLSIPLFWPILVPYLVYCLMSNAATSGTVKHRSQFLKSLPVWSLFASYFPARLHRSIELPPTRKYIFGYHPHGIISHGAWAAFATEALGFSQLFPGITNTLLTLDSNFRVPIYRDYILGMGLASVSRESCENLLSRGGPNKEGMGRAITIVIGGARESLDAQPYTMKLVLRCRKGFVKMGIRCGADLVPVLAFGENDLYDQYQVDEHPYIHQFQMMVKKFLGFTVPLFHARGVFNYDVGLMPYRRPINIVVGRPVKVVQSSKPSPEEVDRVHSEYVAELQRLWDLWKDDFAPHRKGELQIIE